MSPDATRKPSYLRDGELECPDCSTPLGRLGDGGRRTTPDGGAGEANAGDERELQGIDVNCEHCGTELGIYFIP